ncbi:MAG TPA: acyl carrier protein [Gemmataceae bacterium]|jgi:acyl carrier protein|nr:acyl carrier protein [Gemmataceae bacterium]
MSASDEIYGKVVRVLVEALNVDEEEVKPAASLQGDLGAESIDFLDLVFRLEREFAIKIPRGELFPESVFQGDPEFVHDGRVTENGLGELHARMPYANLDSFAHDRRLSAIPDLFTVDLVVRYIAWKLGQGGAAGSKDNRANGIANGITGDFLPVHQEY